MLRFVQLGFKPVTAWLLRIGIPKAMVAITAFSLAVSVVLSFTINWLKGELLPIHDWLLPSALAPLLISPAVAYTVLSLAYRLNAATAALHIAATTDPLTGAANRRFLLDHAKALTAHQPKVSDVISIAVIDIDHFKTINDTYGHATGDAALVAVSAICRGRLRRSDVFCRWGGEEFLAVLEHTDSDQAWLVADELRKAVEAMCLPEIRGKLTVSIGLATMKTPFRDDAFDVALRDADRQLYRAKSTGRNRVMPLPAALRGLATVPADPVTVGSRARALTRRR